MLNVSEVTGLGWDPAHAGRTKLVSESLVPGLADNPLFWLIFGVINHKQPQCALCAPWSSLSDLLVLAVNSGDIFIAGRSTAPISYRTHQPLTSD